MTKLLANAAIAMSLMLSASVSAPVWAGNPDDKKCTAAKHKHAKRTTLPAKAQPNRGTMLVEQRKMDVQILSFGP